MRQMSAQEYDQRFFAKPVLSEAEGLRMTKKGCRDWEPTLGLRKGRKKKMLAALGSS